MKLIAYQGQQMPGASEEDWGRGQSLHGQYGGQPPDDQLVYLDHWAIGVGDKEGVGTEVGAGVSCVEAHDVRQKVDQGERGPKEEEGRGLLGGSLAVVGGSHPLAYFQENMGASLLQAEHTCMGASGRPQTLDPP